MNTFLSFLIIFFFFNERPRSLASPLLPVFVLGARRARPLSGAISRDFATRAPPRTIFIYRSNSFGRWKDSRLHRERTRSFVDVNIRRGGFRAKAARTIADGGQGAGGEAKKTLHAVIMACGAEHELTWNIPGGETLCRCVITRFEKDILSSGGLPRRIGDIKIQFTAATVLAKQFRHLDVSVERIPRFFFHRKIETYESSKCAFA